MHVTVRLQEHGPLIECIREACEKVSNISNSSVCLESSKQIFSNIFRRKKMSLYLIPVFTCIRGTVSFVSETEKTAFTKNKKIQHSMTIIFSGEKTHKILMLV